MTDDIDWNVDPDEWPHTPPLAVFRGLYADDDNVWWRMDSGHALNLYTEAVERIETLEMLLEEVRNAAAYALADAPDERDTPVAAATAAGLPDHLTLIRQAGDTLRHIRAAARRHDVPLT